MNINKKINETINEIINVQLMIINVQNNARSAPKLKGDSNNSEIGICALSEVYF